MALLEPLLRKAYESSEVILIRRLNGVVIGALSWLPEWPPFSAFLPVVSHRPPCYTRHYFEYAPHVSHGVPASNRDELFANHG